MHAAGTEGGERRGVRTVTGVLDLQREATDWAEMMRLIDSLPDAAVE